MENVIKYTYNLFNRTKTVSVDSEIIQKFEECMYPFSTHTAEYMVINEGLDENSPPEEMSEAIIKGIEYEIFLSKNGPDAIADAIERGVIE